MLKLCNFTIASKNCQLPVHSHQAQLSTIHNTYAYLSLYKIVAEIRNVCCFWFCNYYQLSLKIDEDKKWFRRLQYIVCNSKYIIDFYWYVRLSVMMKLIDSTVSQLWLFKLFVCTVSYSLTKIGIRRQNLKLKIYDIWCKNNIMIFSEKWYVEI